MCNQMYEMIFTSQLIVSHFNIQVRNFSHQTLDKIDIIQRHHGNLQIVYVHEKKA